MLSIVLCSVQTAQSSWKNNEKELRNKEEQSIEDEWNCKQQELGPQLVFGWEE